MRLSKYEQEKKVVADAVATFPATFGMRAFAGSTFRVSATTSYVNDIGVVMLYTEIQSGDRWLSFAKGSVAELRAQIIDKPAVSK